MIMGEANLMRNVKKYSGLDQPNWRTRETSTKGRYIVNNSN